MVGRAVADGREVGAAVGATVAATVVAVGGAVVGGIAVGGAAWTAVTIKVPFIPRWAWSGKSQMNW